jgi:hypothetical protein
MSTSSYPLLRVIKQFPARSGPGANKGSQRFNAGGGHKNGHSSVGDMHPASVPVSAKILDFGRRHYPPMRSNHRVGEAASFLA